MGNTSSALKQEENSVYLPFELLHQIFLHLDNIKDLKNCRLASRLFCFVINYSELLADISCNVHTCLKIDEPPKNNNLYGTNLRLEDFTDNPDFADLFPPAEATKLWFNSLTQNFITDLELKNCMFTVKAFDRLIAALPNLEALTWTTTIDKIAQVWIDDYDLNSSEKAKNILRNVKKLAFTTAGLGYFVNLFANDEELKGIERFVIENCTNLKILEIEGHHIWLRTDHITTMLQRNSGTLEEFKYVTFIPFHKKDFCLRYRKPLNLFDFRQQFDNLFEREEHRFTIFLLEMDQSNWLNFGLNLTKLELSFDGIILYTDDEDEGLEQRHLPLFNETFLPFLSQQKQLKEFSLGQIYSPGLDILQTIQTSVNPKCALKLQLIDTIRKPQNRIALEDLEVGEQLVRYIMDMKNYTNIHFDNSDIINHRDSTVQLTFNNPKSEIYVYFVAWKYLDPNLVMRNLSNITKLIIYQGGLAQSKQIIISDTEIQQIILNGMNLTHLFIEHCNLELATDFGLTGITQEASNRMLANNDFVIQDGDIAGVAVSSLKCLMHLKLKPLGNQVTDTTAHFGFKGMKMKSFSITASNISVEGKKVLRNGFVNYNSIQCRIH